MNKGFTLLELLLYTSLVGILFMSLTSVSVLIFQSRVKNQTIAEVEQQGVQAMQIITQSIRNTENITSPAVGTSAPSMTLDLIGTVNDPTVIAESGTALQITEGVIPAVSLTSSKVSVSNVSFNNISRTSTPGIIKIQFTISYINSSGRNEYDFSKTFYGTAALRQ